jgi:TolB-like protein/DNA-binding winged helix-turn-helix (wHTH) protein
MAEYGQFEFDQFVFDPLAGQLLREGREVLLRPKSLEVLRLLVVNAGQLVTKDQLFATAWPKTVVTDDALVQCVRDIRVALRDDQQRMVRTIPRRGYIFTSTVVPRGGVRPAEVTPPLTLPKSVASMSPLSNSLDGLLPWLRRHRLSATLVGLAVAVAAVTWMATGVHGGRQGAAPSLSIVVLPLVNLNGDPQQEYFAEGLTEDLTTDLSRIPGSFVIARSSAYSFRGKAIDVRDIGRQLGVRYALEGSVQRLDEQVRLNVQLIDLENGRTLWADRFDGSRRDLVALQQRVTGTIARSLHLELIEAESQRASRERARDPNAWDLALQGWSLYERRTPESVATARALLLKSVSIDPGSVFAWSLLSDTYTADLLARWLHLRGATRAEWLQRATQAADQAITLDPANLYAIGARATVLQLEGKPEQSLAMLRRQVAQNRNYAPAWHRISYALVTLGQPETALEAGNEAIRLSPRDGRLFSFYVVMAAACLHLGRDAEALEWARKSVTAWPQFGTAHSWVASASALLGDMTAAHAALAEFRRLQPGYTIESFRAEKLSDNAVFLGQHERYYRGLQLAGLP